MKNKLWNINDTKQTLLKSAQYPLRTLQAESRFTRTKEKNNNKNNKKINKFNTDTNSKSNYVQDPYDRTITLQGEKREKIPSNINDYRHMISANFNWSKGDLKWTLNLRNYHSSTLKTKPETEPHDPNFKGEQDNEIEEHKEIKIVPPSFYDEDWSKYKKKKTGARPPTSNPNFTTIAHWINRNYTRETCNNTQFNFATSLRQVYPFKEEKYKNEFYNKTPWAGISVSTRNKEVELPYTVKTIQTTVGKDSIRQRKYLKLDSPEKLVHHLGKYKYWTMRPYSSLYKDPNSFSDKQILAKHTNSQCLFEWGWRVYGKVERKRVRRWMKGEWKGDNN